MLFGEVKLDGLITRHKVIQLSFMTAYAANHYKQALIDDDYIDITHYFTQSDVTSINVQELKELMSESNTILDLNVFYNHWVILSGKSYHTITWAYYELIKQLLSSTLKNFVGIAHRRTIATAIEHKIDPLDTTLLCDFADLYIYPLYYEYKLYTADMKSFDNFIDQVGQTGEVPDKYNICMIQYMKLGGNATEKIFY